MKPFLCTFLALVIGALPAVAAPPIVCQGEASGHLQGFDADGSYVRRWVPELANVPHAYLHQPHTMPDTVQRAVGCVIGTDYPAPIVDHAVARERALAAYAAARAGATGSR